MVTLGVLKRIAHSPAIYIYVLYIETCVAKGK